MLDDVHALILQCVIDYHPMAATHRDGMSEKFDLLCCCCNQRCRWLCQSKLLKSILELVVVAIVIIFFTFLRCRPLVIWRFVFKIKLLFMLVHLTEEDPHNVLDHRQL